jgi:hypothetical protein
MLITEMSAAFRIGQSNVSWKNQINTIYRKNNPLCESLESSGKRINLPVLNIETVEYFYSTLNTTVPSEFTDHWC